MYTERVKKAWCEKDVLNIVFEKPTKYKKGESVDLDTTKARIQGLVILSMDNLIKVKIANIIEKGN